MVNENLEMDDFLAKELETQNTCPVCYDLMVRITFVKNSAKKRPRKMYLSVLWVKDSVSVCMGET